MNIEYSEAIVEVLELLKHTEKELVDKIPHKLIEFWNKIASSNYKANINHSEKIENMNLKQKTKALLGMIYRNYWCTPEERKEYDIILKENEERYQEECRKKYNPDDIFKSNTQTIANDSVTSFTRNKFAEIESENILEEESQANIIEYKENFFMKIIQKLKSY